MSNKSMNELNQLNNAYMNRAKAMQQNWINDWVTLQQTAIASAMNPHHMWSGNMSSNMHQKMLKQYNEYAEFVSNACESYSLWLIKQANQNN